jgi:hypothetical protein
MRGVRSERADSGAVDVFAFRKVKTQESEFVWSSTLASLGGEETNQKKNTFSMKITFSQCSCSKRRAGAVLSGHFWLSLPPIPHHDHSSFHKSSVPFTF